MKLFVPNEGFIAIYCSSPLSLSLSLMLSTISELKLQAQNKDVLHSTVPIINITLQCVRFSSWSADAKSWKITFSTIMQN